MSTHELCGQSGFFLAYVLVHELDHPQSHLITYVTILIVIHVRVYHLLHCRKDIDDLPGIFTKDIQFTVQQKNPDNVKDKIQGNALLVRLLLLVELKDNRFNDTCLWVSDSALNFISN